MICMTYWVLCLYSLILSDISSSVSICIKVSYTNLMCEFLWMLEFAVERQLSMHFQSVCGFLCIFVLLFNSVWSWEVTNFHWVKSDKGELVCGMSPPNKTLKDIGSRALCMSACCYNVCPCPCQAFNYWTNSKRCQHFYYIPCSYAVQEDCINYQVATTIIATLSQGSVVRLITVRQLKLPVCICECEILQWIFKRPPPYGCCFGKFWGKITFYHREKKTQTYYYTFIHRTKCRTER